MENTRVKLYIYIYIAGGGGKGVSRPFLVRDNPICLSWDLILKFNFDFDNSRA